MTLDLASSYWAVADTMLLDARQVADPFHVVRVPTTASMTPDGGSSRNSSGTGRKYAPLYRARRLMVMADERLTDHARPQRPGTPQERDHIKSEITNWTHWRVCVLIYAWHSDLVEAGHTITPGSPVALPKSPVTGPARAHSPACTARS